MYFDTLTLAAITDQLRETVLDGRIQRVVRPTQLSIALEVYNHGQRHHLLLSAHPQFARVQLLGSRPSRGVETDSPLLLLLRKYVLGGRIIGVEQPELERIVLLSIVKGPQARNSDDPALEDDDDEPDELLRCELVAEIMDRRSNVILVGDDNMIKESVRHVTPQMSRRPVQPHEPYELPPKQEKRTPHRVTAEGLRTLASTTGETDMARAIVSAYAGVSPQVAREAMFRATGKTTGAPNDDMPFETLAATLRALFSPPWQPSLAFDTEGQPRAYAAYELRQFGSSKPQPTMSVAIERFYAAREQLGSHSQRRDHLTAALNESRERIDRQRRQLAEQMEQARLLDKLRWEGEMIYAFLYSIQPRQTTLDVEDQQIKLNPELSAVENAQARFRAYDKAKGALANVPELLANAEHRLAGLDERLALLALAESFDQIEEIAREAEDQEFLRPSGRKRGKARRHPPLRVMAGSGHTIYVGRSAGQNEQVTFKLAAPDDIWLHARNIPGAHVIIKGSNIPEATIREAADLAAYYSSARGDTSVEVEVARRRNVKRVPGGPTGLVTYRAEQTIRATPQPPR